MEEKVISCIYKDRLSFEKIRELTSDEEVFSDINAILFNKAREYYETDPQAQFIDIDLVRSYIGREYPRHADIIEIALDRIERDETSCDNVVKEYTQLKLHSLGQQIASAIIANHDPRDIIARYSEVYSGADEDTGDGLPGAATYDDIAIALDPENIIELYPPDLQDRVKYATRGHHILIFARPETGKSMFTINMARGFLDQGLKVLYIGNEDPASAMLPRFFGSFIGATREELSAMDSREVNEKIKAAGNDNFRFIHLEPGTFSQIRGLCRIMKPDVLIVDQIRNVLTGGDGLTIGLERAGAEMRNIGASFNLLAVSITQAGESASSKLVLGLSDIDSSKTGLPATVDTMIGIGINEDYEGRSKRMISLPKNKIGSDHSFFSVDVDPSKARIL